MPTLKWIGKEAVENHHLEIPYKLLKCDSSLSAGDKESGNLIVQGDNLEALKALLPYYAGRVKCIYIDPPYNTGNEGWAYNDNVNSPEIKEWLKQTVKQDDLSRHDKWLCMMYPRLQLLREFLDKDGVIFISIDDNEFANLKLLMDEIFGGNQFITSIIWQRAYAPVSLNKYFSTNHDYLLVYARQKSNYEVYKLARTEKQNKDYKNPDNDPRGLWKSGNPSVGPAVSKNIYEIITPSGRKILPPKGRSWLYSKERFEALSKDNRIWFGKDGNSIWAPKMFLSEVSSGVTPMTTWLYEEVGHTQDAKKELKQIFNDDLFATPKPSTLIDRILRISTNSTSLILDSFAGSGTTAHSVLKLNNEDGGNRRFILIEMENKICNSITAERIRKVINGYETIKTNDEIERVEGLKGGFKYCILDQPLFDEFGNIRQNVTFSDLAHHVFFTETGVPLDAKFKKKEKSTQIGIYKETAYYLLFNGIIGDKNVNGGNVLTTKILEKLSEYKGKKIIYGEGCRLSPSRLKRENIIFKQLPYEVKVS